MFQITIPVRDSEPPPTVPYKDEKTITDAKWIEGLASKREPKFRVATPDKRNIQDLSHSFEKHRLGKQQRLLQDLNLRCRVQEVSDMSSGITRKVGSHGGPLLHSISQNVPLSPADAPESKIIPQDVSDASTVATDDTTLSLHDRTHTMFPPTKRMLKSPRKSHHESTGSLPQLNIEHSRGVNKHTLELPLNKANIIKDSTAFQMNGRIQFDHIMSDKQNQLSPLVVSKRFRVANGKDRIDSYVYSKKASLYPKGRYGSRSQWDLYSRHSDRLPAGGGPGIPWQSQGRITIPSSSQSARD